MAFPQVVATNNGYLDSAGTNHTCNLPSGISSGDLLMLFFGWYTGTTANTPSGWSSLGIENNGTNIYQVVFYKIATGSEGSTVAVTTSSSTKSSHVSYRITGHDATTAPQKGTAVTGTTANPDPPSLSPSWGAADTLFIATQTNRNDSFTSYPTSHPDNQVRGGNTSTSSSSETAICSDEQNVTSNNPGTYTLSTSRYWVANTYAVRPSQGPIITSMEDDLIEPIGGGNYETDNVLVGTLFGTTQGTGKVELGSAATYAGSGTKVTQTIDSWSNTSIQFDAVRGALSEGTVWIYVTNNSGQTNAAGYPVQLGWPAPIITDMEDEQLDTAETDNVITGDYFLSSQGTGKVEICNNAVYASATIKIMQTIDTWAFTSIQFDFVQSTLPNGTGWIFVTTDDGKLSNGYAVNMGPIPQDTYEEDIQNLTNPPQHLWTLQNTFADAGVSSYLYAANTSGNGSPGFSTATPLLCRGDTHAFLLAAANQYTSPNEAFDNPRSENDDYNAAHNTQYKAVWFRFDRYHQVPSILMEEGANVNDMCILVGFGNSLLVNCLSDTGDVQVFSDKPMRPNRNYFVVLKLEGNTFDNEVAMYVDGVRQVRDSGNPWGIATFLLHNGDLSLGWNQQTGTYGQMNVGGTVLQIGTAIGTRYSHWMSWHDIQPTEAEIWQMFERGVGPDFFISSDTPANMQIDMESYDNTSHNDAALVFYVDAPSGANNLTLTLTNQVFHEDTSLQIQWRGGGVLTLINSGTTNLDASKCSNPWGGSIVIISQVTVKVHVLDIEDNSDIVGARVYLTAAAGGPLSEGTVILNDVTDTNGEVSISFSYNANQPISGKIAHSTTGILHVQSGVVTEITQDGLDIDVFLIRDI